MAKIDTINMDSFNSYTLLVQRQINIYTDGSKTDIHIYIGSGYSIWSDLTRRLKTTTRWINNSLSGWAHGYQVSHARLEIPYKLWTDEWSVSEHTYRLSKNFLQLPSTQKQEQRNSQTSSKITNAAEIEIITRQNNLNYVQSKIHPVQQFLCCLASPESRMAPKLTLYTIILLHLV